MGSLLEEMHKMRLKEKIDELESMGGNPHVADHGLGGVYRCKVCGYIFDENKETIYNIVPLPNLSCRAAAV